MAQNTRAVNNDDVAYTSASTAENQNVSEKAYARAPVSPAAIIAIVCPNFGSEPDDAIIFFARWVMVQKRNIIVNALARADMIFDVEGYFAETSETKRLKNLASIINIGAPGG